MVESRGLPRHAKLRQKLKLSLILFLFYSYVFWLFVDFWSLTANHQIVQTKLSRHRNADDIAPLADALVGLDVDGLVFPERALAGGGHGRGVGVIGYGVNRQKHKAFAVAAIHLNFQSVHALLRPAYVHFSGVQFHIQNGFEGGRVNGIIRADELQGLADGIGVAGRDLDAGDQRGGAAKDAGRNRRRRNASAGATGARPSAGPEPLRAEFL